MERTLSQEDRIRRAEEIYYRRQNAVKPAKIEEINVNQKKNYKLLKKIIVQIIVCIFIYTVIYKLQANTDSFSIDSIQYLKGTMAYDIDFNKVFKEAKEYIATWNWTNGETKPEEKAEENIVNENVEIENNEEQTGTNEEEQIIDENAVIPDDTSTLSQMEQDALYIKSNFSIIKPVTGPVTSRFGLRNPTTPTVPKNHTGIDIGVPEGTIIVSAMEGEVTQVSTIGDYRKSHKNQKRRCNNTICTLQNNLCKRRGQNNTRAANRKNRQHRKRNRTTPAL